MFLISSASMLAFIVVMVSVALAWQHASRRQRSARRFMNDMRYYASESQRA
jgi:hypothetical protein